MQILEKDAEQNLFVNLDAGVIQSILLGLKEAVHNKIIGIPLKQELSKSLEKYIDASLKNISFNDKTTLLAKLSENFELVKPLIDACLKVQERFSDRFLSVNVHTEKEDLTFFSISLTIKCEDFNEKDIDDIESFSSTVSSPFYKHGVLMYLEPEFT